MLVSLNYPAAPTPPLACDCAGAAVYIKLLHEYRSATRDGHGVLRGTLTSRTQSTNGTWTYSFTVDITGLIDPPPGISGGMIESICCQGCLGYAAEAYNQDAIGGRLLNSNQQVVFDAMLPVCRVIRPFYIEDWRAYLAAPASLPVKLHLHVGGQVSSNPLVIPAGSIVSDKTYSFIDGSSFLVPEDSFIQVRVVSTASNASGLETWFWGHHNPSIVFAPLPPMGAGSVNMVGTYEILLDPSTPVGSEYHQFPYVYKKTSFGVIQIDGNTEFTAPTTP